MQKSTVYVDHTITLNERILSPEDGLILGNGDLSVSIYQRQSEIVWRFGKGDVWDRRFENKEDAKPLTIAELRHGLTEEGWKCSAFGLGNPKAVRGTKDPLRMLNVLGSPPSYTYPYPMPKPVGELSLRWPEDLQGLKIEQKLHIEKGQINITCEWLDGEQLYVNCFIHPSLNILTAQWKFENWHPGMPQPVFKDAPILLSLYRWPDPPVEEFAAEWIARYNYSGFEGMKNANAVPLPPPQIVKHNGHLVIEQKFYPDPSFPEGFKYWLGCITDQPSIEHVNLGVNKEARLFISSAAPTSFGDMCDYTKMDESLRKGTVDYPEQRSYEGWIAVPVTTSNDVGGTAKQFDSLCEMLKTEPISVISDFKQETLVATGLFWAASSLRTSEEFIENLWYETLHISRCIYKNGTVPPGLFVPCTINDYSLWHGDYHTNYNIQQPFWGFHTANHLELVEPYFTIMDFFSHIGKKIAHDYCETRGIFIQVSGYPILLSEDPFPTSPMARMPYMTGWAPELFWWHYLYARDIDFLANRAYPFIRDCAMFYTDFLQLGEDGLYHAFPSCFGEEGYDGDPATNTDAVQTIEYAASSMRIALKAAQILDIDKDLQGAWEERINNLAPAKGQHEYKRPPEAFHFRHQQFNMPSFLPGEYYRHPNRFSLAKRWWGWIDKLTIMLMCDIRGGSFRPERDYGDLLRVLKRWRHQNGLLWPMPIRYYGQCGGWTEALGIIAPLQEMLLQSWDGLIRVFPAWPNDVDASFEQFMSQGAFLVSACFQKGKILPIRIKSLVGGECKIICPWPGATCHILEENTKQVLCEQSNEIVSFTTQADKEYLIEISDKKNINSL